MDINSILPCPQCDAGRIENATCLSCEQQFDVNDGILSLFPSEKPVAYPLPYVALEHVKATLNRAFQTPNGSGASRDVYHLDQGHAPHFTALASGAIVLEVGCGGGQMRRWVEDLGLTYVGTDVSRTRVHAHLQEFGGADFLSDVHNLPIADQSVDLVYSAAVTEHLAAPRRAAQEIFRVLKPGGVYLGNCSFMEPWHDESFFHMSPNGAAALLLQAGFEPIAIWPSHNYSGYKSLLNMDNSATKMMRPFGAITHGISRSFYMMKRGIRGSERYSDRARLADHAKTAGAIDWAARKPE